MFAGFDPQGGQSFFERKRGQSLLGALLLVGGSLGTAFYMASRELEEPVEEVVVEAELQNFEMDEELEEEPEPEPEPEPPPPPSPDKPVKRSAKPTPEPAIQNPDAIDDAPKEGEINSEGPGYGEGGGGGTGSGGGGGEAKEPEPEAKPEPKPEPKKKRDTFVYNPDKPIERPAEATVPKQVGGNPPVYPDALKKRNITGKVKVRLTIYKDGSVKGAKVLAKSNSVDQAAEPDLYDKVNKLLLKAVAAAVQTWKFKPSTYKGKPLTVYHTITIPFTLQ